MDEDFPNRAEPRNRARGVTLVEVLIVVAILSMIAGGVAIFAIPRYMKAQRDMAQTNARTLSEAVNHWRLDSPSRVAECPRVEDLKTAKVLAPDAITKDPWGKSYEIVCENGDHGVWSPGPDGQPGTDDDVSVGVASKVR